MAEEQAGDQGAGGEQGGEAPAPRKELEGFQVTRSAPTPPPGNPMLVPIVVVVVLLVGGGIAATQLGGGGDDTPATTAGATDTPAATTGTPPPDDEEVPDYVWDRLDFLEGEGNISKALDVAEEAESLTPNSQLREKIAGYKRELGLDLEELNFDQAMAQARAALSAGKHQDAVDYASVAIERNADDSEAFLVRGTALGRLGDKAAAIEDLDTALELGHQPADQVETLIKQFEQ